MPKPRIRDVQTAQRLLDLRRDEYRTAVEELTEQLHAGKLSLGDWRAGVRQEIKDLNTQALIYGRAGEWETLTKADFGGLGADLKAQYHRLDELALHVQSSAGGTITTGDINLRLSTYGDLADRSFWRGVGAGFPDVPPRIRNVELGAKLLQVRRLSFNDAVIGLNGQLRSGSISLGQWRAAMRQQIKDLHTSALIIARGGEYDLISKADWGRLGGRLKRQYAYLDGYAAHVQGSAEGALVGEGTFLSEAYMNWRGQLYGGAANGTYWQSVVYGQLPQVPGDGKTQCRTNCQCRLRIEDGDQPGLLLVYWELGEAEHCPDCVRLASEWNPYELEMPLAAVAAAMGQDLALGAYVARLLSGLEHKGIGMVVYYVG